MRYNPVNPFKNTPHVDKFLHSIDWYQLANTSKTGIQNKIGKIIALKNVSPPRYMHYFSAMIYNLKQIHKDERLGRRSHVLTDHAFVRCLEFVGGVDILYMKDKALRKLEESDYYPIYGKCQRQIVTIYPKENK